MSSVIHKKSISSLRALEIAAINRKAVVCVVGTYCSKPLPAAFVIQFQGSAILRMIKEGLYLYEKIGGKNEGKWYSYQ